MHVSKFWLLLEPAPVEEEPPTPVTPPAKDPNSYNTAFGEVLLEGELMHGPYQVQPKPHKAGPIGAGRDVARSKVTVDSENVLQGPRLRTIASEALMKQLNQPPPPPPAVVEEPPAPQPVSQDATSSVITLLQTLAGVSQHNHASNESIAKAVQDGVQLGVKQALGFLDNSQSVTEREVREQRDAKRLHRDYTKGDYEVYRNKTASAGRRKEYPLYRPVVAQPPLSEEEAICPPGLLKIGGRPSSSRAPPRSNEARRDPVHLGRNGHSSTLSEQAILKDIESSKRHAQALVERDVCCSFDDSLSLSEEAAAHLDPELYSRDYGYQQSGLTRSVDSRSSLQSGDTEIPHQTLYRSKLTKDCVELFDQQAKARRVVSAYGDRTRDEEEKWYESPDEAVGGGKIPKVLALSRPGAPESAYSQFKPLVSKVLGHSATEDMLRGGHGLVHHFSSTAARAAGAVDEDLSLTRDSEESRDEESFAADDNKYYSEQTAHNRAARRDEPGVSVKPRLHIQRAAPAASHSRLDDSAESAGDALLDISAEPRQSRDSHSGDEAEDRETFLREMVNRQTLYSAAGIERDSPMHASSHLPREYPIGSSRIPALKPRKQREREETEVTVAERDARHINRQVSGARNSHKLLVDPHQVIGTQKGRNATAAAASAGERRMDTLRSEADSTHSSVSSWSASFDRRGRDKVASRDDSFSRSSHSSTASFSEQSTLSSADAPHGRNFRASTNAREPTLNDNLADQMMLDLLGRQRASTGRSLRALASSPTRAAVAASGRASNVIDKYRDEFSSSEEDDSRDQSSLLNVTGSTESSVGEFTRSSAPNRLLTVSDRPQQQGQMRFHSSGAIKAKSWR